MTGSLIPDLQRAVDWLEGWLQALWQVGWWGRVLLAAAAALLTVAVLLFGFRHRRDGRFTRDLGRLAAIAFAAAAGWAAAGAAGSTYQAFAAAAAVGSVGLGIAYSMRDAASSVAATAAGLLCADLVVAGGLPGLWSVLVAAGVGWGVATWFGATPVTASAAAVASVFAAALGAHLTDTVIVDRLGATVIGAAVGIAVSALPWWGTPARAAEADVRELAGDIADVWRRIGGTVEAGTDRSAAAEALHESRELVADAEEVRSRVEAAVGHMRLSPASRARDEGARLARLGVAVSHGAEQVNNAARALFDLADAGQGAALSTAEPVRDAADTAADVYDGISRDTLQAIDAANLAGRLDQLASQTVEQLRRGDDDTGVVLAAGQMVAAAAATGDALRGTAAIETDLPDVDDIVPALKPPRR